MRKFERLSKPDFLTDDNVKKWTGAWEALNTKGSSFAWPQIDGEKLNLKLLQTLKKQTQDHCSFCDGYPIDVVSMETIEHFHPKSIFIDKAYDWHNLYFACTQCQNVKNVHDRKKESDSSLLLKPDDKDYNFYDYFYWDYDSGVLEIIPSISEEKKAKAEQTKSAFGLNDCNRPVYRKEQRRRWFKCNDTSKEDLDAWPYRDFIST